MDAIILNLYLNILCLKIFNSIDEFEPMRRTMVTLGTFDGVHIGHRKIVDRLIQHAFDEDCESLILTFFPHPRMVLQDATDIKLLNTIDERAALLKDAGLDSLIIHPFDKAFSRLTADEFVNEILVKKLNVKKIIIGHDHRFGRNRTASIDDLVKFGIEYGFEVEQISAREVNDVSVSSTKIRNALIDGNIALANEYLGYEYMLNGIVVRGKQLGRTIGFPTANLKITEDYKLIPKDGVYIVKSLIGSKVVYGMMNIGNNPTVNGTTRSVEIFYFNFTDDIYDTKLTISMLHRIRDEQKFESVELLKQQLHRDAVDANDFINKM
jgi:riboflavin kinase/FMN adenylyltransferase